MDRKLEFFEGEADYKCRHERKRIYLLINGRKGAVVFEYLAFYFYRKIFTENEELNAYSLFDLSKMTSKSNAWENKP